MSLVVRVSVEPGKEPVGTLVIQRDEELRGTDEAHRYTASLHDQNGMQMAEIKVDHQYNHGAWVLIHAALEALGETAGPTGW